MRKWRGILIKLITATLAMGKSTMDESISRKNRQGIERLSKRIQETMEKKEGKAACLKIEITFNWGVKDHGIRNTLGMRDLH